MSGVEVVEPANRGTALGRPEAADQLADFSDLGTIAALDLDVVEADRGHLTVPATFQNHDVIKHKIPAIRVRPKIIPDAESCHQPIKETECALSELDTIVDGRKRVRRRICRAF